jgi:protein-S-isoprenylcysteine O-methyltransferase Ste14
MRFNDHMESSGNWLFRYRSYLPILVFCGIIFTLAEFTFPAGRHSLQEIWMLGCLATSCIGLGVRLFTVGHAPARTSGRNTARQVAVQVNTTGIYSVVRHPLYLGNYLMWLGAAATTRSPWFVATMTLIFWLYHERIIFAEEAFLERTHGEVFRDWAERTPAFIPRLKLWNASSLPFSLRHAIRREYLGAFGLVSTFAVLDHIEDWHGRGRFEFEPLWISGWAVAFAIFLGIRLLAKLTRVLHVTGR